MVKALFSKWLPKGYASFSFCKHLTRILSPPYQSLHLEFFSYLPVLWRFMASFTILHCLIIGDMKPYVFSGHLCFFLAKVLDDFSHFSYWAIFPYLTRKWFLCNVIFCNHNTFCYLSYTFFVKLLIYNIKHLFTSKHLSCWHSRDSICIEIHLLFLNLSMFCYFF